MNDIEKKNEIVAWLLSRYAAEKGKILLTFGLLCVMGFMWIKVLNKKSPQSANAAANAETQANQIESEVKLEYFDLPSVEGKHNRLNKDFFSPTSFSGFGSSPDSVNVSFDGSDNAVESIAQQLTLEAIITGDNPEAFINDQFYKVGEVIEVERNKKKYKFELAKIMKDKAQLKCNDTLVEIKIAEAEIEN